MQRALDILDLVIAAVDEIDAHAAVQMLMNGIRNRYPARIGKPLYAGRDIDAVPIKIAAVDHDIAEIDADAQHDAPIRRVIFVRGGHGLLQLDRAFDRADGAAELDKHPVADFLKMRPAWRATSGSTTSFHRTFSSVSVAVSSRSMSRL